MRLIAHSADALYRGIITNLFIQGARTFPRGIATREVIASHLTLTNANKNIVTFPARKLNYAFMVAEWLYIMNGGNHAPLLAAFNSQMSKFAESDRFAGAYGPKVVEQLPYVIETLQKDPDSRQAVLTIWRERPRHSVDIPCTVGMQFFVRNLELELIVYMRSNDVWLGFPYDLFNFTQIQRYVAAQLGYKTGLYHHMVGSLHLYDTNSEQAKTILDDKGVPIYAQEALAKNTQLLELHAAMYEIAVTDWKGLEQDENAGYRAEDIIFRYEGLCATERGYLETLLWRAVGREPSAEPWATLVRYGR